MPGGWSGSTRKAGLPPNWPALRRVVLLRDGFRCTWPTELGRCVENATDVDHIGDKDNHEPENLRALCGYHHRQRTSLQGNKARGRGPSERYPREQHPGLRPAR